MTTSTDSYDGIRIDLAYFVVMKIGATKDDSSAGSTWNFKRHAPETPKPRKQNNKTTKPRLDRLSILSPPIPTCHTLIKARHRLISTPNLHLEERRLITIASLSRTLHPALLGVIPRSGTAENILTLFPLVHAPRVDGLGDCVLERAGSAFEAVGAVDGE
jgi:hypothetical protein